MIHADWFVGPQRTVALMATTDCLYLLKQNFHQPEPVKSGPLLDQFSGPQFVTIASEKIVNVNEMVSDELSVLQ